MYITANDLKTENYIIVNARTVAAAAMYTSKDASRPILNAIEITTDENGHVSCTASDSYRLGHFESLPISVGNPANARILLNIGDLGKFIPATPKISEWVAIRETTHCKQQVVEVTKISSNTSSESVFSLGQTAYASRVEGNFPEWRKIVQSAETIAKKGSAVGPNLNTPYLIDCFKSMNTGVSYTGIASTSFIHGSETDPIYLEAHNEAGEYGLVLLMPVRSDLSRLGAEVKRVEVENERKATKERVKIEKENVKLKAELAKFQEAEVSAA